MTQRDDRSNHGLHRPPWTDGRSSYGVALFGGLGLMLIGIVIGMRISMGPPLSVRDAPARGPATEGLSHTTKSVPIDQLRRTAIAEVKRREGWTGEAAPPSQEGNTYYFWISRDSKSPKLAVQVGVDCVTGKVTDYQGQ